MYRFDTLRWWSTVFRDFGRFSEDRRDGWCPGDDEERRRSEGWRTESKRRVASSKQAEATGSVEETFEAEAEEGTARESTVDEALLQRSSSID